ncbi:MAG: histone deacetylase [Chitinophagaceae bacterium]|nr:MAG: histone deacetylase [Chitinophagaceae bacterium]
MLKYELIPGQLLYEGTITEQEIHHPGICSDETVLLTHTREYLDKLHGQSLSPQEQRRIGFPQSPALTTRELMIAQGTIDNCRHAISNGIAFNVAGGTHHAFAGHGEGFCMLNDFAVAANYLLSLEQQQLFIVDLDVHQGNGTARIFEDNPAVFTFSMHGGHNYPFHKEKSDLDIPLPDGAGDDLYLGLLRDTLPSLVDRLRPSLVFYLSGVDILSTDKFGKLKVSMDGCRQRDEFVFQTLYEAGIHCVVSMGGGYSPDVRTIVEAHCNTFRVAREIYQA